MDDEGASMLINILNTSPDWERLEQAGISFDGIDFIKRMLVIEPSNRVRETEQLRHPWLSGKVTKSTDQTLCVGGDGAIDLDASQLSLAERENQDGFEDALDEIEDPREAKRSRYHENTEPNAPVDLFGGIAHEYSLEGISSHQWNANESLDSMNDLNHPQNHQPQGNRLFGEIGLSALRSSGVLGENIQVALDVPGGGSYDPSSNEPSYVHPEMASAENVSYANSNEHFGHTDLSPTPHPLQYPQLLPGHPYAGPAPSLLGTEALVGQLNMASPESGVSSPSVDNKPTTPRTPTSPDFVPDYSRDKASSGASKEASTQATPKQVTVERSQHDAPHCQPSQSKTVSSSADDAVSSAQAREGSASGELSKSDEFMTGSEMYFDDDAQRMYGTSKSDISLLPTAYNSQGSTQDGEHDVGNHPSSLGAQNPSTPQTNPAVPSSGEHRTLIVPTKESQQPNVFTKPPFRFGNLTPIAGSIHSIPIKITAQGTTFGRDPASDFVHPNSKHDRVPKNAIDIAMWYPGIERDIAIGKPDWHLNENLMALVSTRTSRYIKINNVRLMKGNGCWLYGKLKTGDVITVFGPPEGVDMSRMDSKQQEYLRFHCEFFVGKSKERRRADESFEIEKEEEKFRQHEVRASRESSAVKSRESSQASAKPTE